jgi:hypothetical protein
MGGNLSIKTGVGSLTAGISRLTSLTNQLPHFKVGKVYGTVTTSNTPTSKQFGRAGEYGGMGTVFFLDYNNSKNIVGSNTDDFLDTCEIAKPLFPNISQYPLLNELIYILDLPSPAAQVTSHSTQKYYITTINMWNDPQSNSQPTLALKTPNLGKTFKSNPNVRNLLNFEGEKIFEEGGGGGGGGGVMVGGCTDGPVVKASNRSRH